MFTIKHISVNPQTLMYQIELDADAPKMTSDDLEGTNRVLRLLPGIANHLCLGDSSDRFGDVLSDTEVAHLLEHVLVELLARTGRTDGVAYGKTRKLTNKDNLWETEVDCMDDTLTMAALSSAVWIMTWAYEDGEEPVPDIERTLIGICQLVDNIDRVEFKNTIKN